jgi:PAS domain S-box-containing protein
VVVTRSHLPYRKTFIAVMLLFIGGVLAVTAYSLWRFRAEVIDAGYKTAALHTRSFEDFLTQSIYVTELLAATAVPHGSQLDRPALERAFDKLLRDAPFLRSVSLLDAQNRIVASSNPQNLGIQIATAGFLPMAEADAGLLRIGVPWEGRDFAGGRPTTPTGPVVDRAQSLIPVIKSVITGEDHTTLLFGLNPDYFVNHFVRTVGPDTGVIEIFSYDGVLLLSSDPKAPRGSSHTDFIAALGLDQAEYGRIDRRWQEGPAYLTTYRASRLYPFVVVTNLEREDILDVWRAEAGSLLSTVLSVLFVCSVAAIVFYRRLALYAVQRAEADRLQRLNATAFGASHDAIIITDPDANIVSVNRAFERITGYTQEEVLGQNPRFLSSGKQERGFYAAMWQTILRDGSWKGEMVNRRKDGSLYDTEMTISCSHDRYGRLQHYVGIGPDITERKRAERSLLEAKQAAESANHAKSHFLATMSHEIRTPMNGILGMAQLLLMDDIGEAERRESARTILNSGQTLLTLLNDILDLSKVEAGKLELSDEPFEPAQIVGDTAALFAQLAEAKGLQLDATCRVPPGRRYRSDPLRLRQMLSNLIGNAIKFTARGSVHVTANEIARIDGEALLEFSVIDSGIGIPSEKQALLFHPFTQGDSSTTREFGGTGLGLSIVYSLAKLMRGEVGIESLPDQGARFWFLVRARPIIDGEESCHADRVPAEATLPALAGTEGYVLVVDDNVVNRKVVESLLKKIGVATRSASDGQQALDLIDAGPRPRMVLMDMQMPVMDGLTATRHIREREQAVGLDPLPVIALTANAYEEDRQHCLEAGMNDYLAKPVRFDSLQATVVKWSGPHHD